VGCDLVGRLYKAPRELPADKTAVIDFVRRMVYAYKMVYDQAYKQESFDYYNNFTVLVAKAESRFNVKLESVNYSYVDNLQEVIELDPVELVDALYDVWSGQAPDVYFRTDPDDDETILFFTGGDSYGHDPDGRGYQTIRDADLIGLLEHLNFR
jgi:hypothetical protein